MTDTVRRYECVGTLDHGDGTPPVACECVATQEHDGTISLDCLSPPDAPAPVGWMKGLFGSSIDGVQFVGQLKSGLHVEVKGTLLGWPVSWNQELGTRAKFGLTGNSSLTVGHRDDIAEWRFALVNLVFTIPTDRRGTVANPGEPSVPLALKESPVTIRQVPGYDDAKRQLRQRHSVRLTTEICVPRSVSFETARDLVGDLCSVLSIAQGTLVNWIFVEQSDDAGVLLFALHHPAITRPYSGALPLIDPRPPAEVPAFVEGVFARFRELKASYQLSAIARACADVRTTGFLETRCLQLLSVTEYIIGRHATLQGKEFIMDDHAFQDALGRLKRVISDVLRLAFPALTAQQANRMTDHLKAMNFTTFKRRLRDAAAAFGVQLDQADVEALADTRNELVHRAAFTSDRPLKEFRGSNPSWTGCLWACSGMADRISTQTRSRGRHHIDFGKISHAGQLPPTVAASCQLPDSTCTPHTSLT